MILSVLTLIASCLFLAFINSSNILMQPISDNLIIFIIVIFSLVYMFELFARKQYKDVAVPLFLGYLFRLCLMFFDLYGRAIYVLPNAGSDDDGFFASAVAQAHGLSGRFSDYGELFTNLLGKVFSFCGVSRMLGEFFVLLCSVVALHFAVKIFDIVSVSVRRKRIGVYIVCFLPNFAILSAMLRRESIITMFVTISLYFFLLWFYRKKEFYFVLAFGFVFCASAFHSGTVALAVGYIMVRLFYSSKREKLKISSSGVIVALIFMLVFVFLFNNYGEELFGKMQGAEEIGDIALTSVRGGASYAKYVGNSDSVLNMVIYTIPRIVYFLFSPFPWQWRSASDIIAFCFSSLFYLWVFVRAIRYLISGNQQYKSLVVVLMILALCTAFVFGWGVSNTGTAVRHRDKMVVLYVIMFSVAVPVRENKIKKCLASEI